MKSPDDCKHDEYELIYADKSYPWSGFCNRSISHVQRSMDYLWCFIDANVSITGGKQEKLVHMHSIGTLEFRKHDNLNLVIIGDDGYKIGVLKNKKLVPHADLIKILRGLHAGTSDSEPVQVTSEWIEKILAECVFSEHHGLVPIDPLNLGETIENLMEAEDDLHWIYDTYIDTHSNYYRRNFTDRKTMPRAYEDEEWNATIKKIAACLELLEDSGMSHEKIFKLPRK